MGAVTSHMYGEFDQPDQQSSVQVASVLSASIMTAQHMTQPVGITKQYRSLGKGEKETLYMILNDFTNLFLIRIPMLKRI